MRLTKFWLALLLVLAGTVSLASTAHADTGGYPFAYYHGPESNPSQLIWTDPGGGLYSPYNYNYRNCTDFVAWKLATANGLSLGSSLGHAGQWKESARLRGYPADGSPAVGSVAWFSIGHVAWVEAVNGDLVTIQEYNYDLQGNYNRRTIHRSSAQYIHFRDLAGGGPGSTLTFLKTKNTGSGTIEVHQSPPPYTGYSSSTSGFIWAEQDSGWFSMVGDKLTYIKTHNTGGRVELHWRNAASGYRSGVSTTTWFSSADQNNGWFSMMGTDVVFIKTKNTGQGRVEVHRVGAANYNAPPSSFASVFSSADADNGWFQLYGSSQDLVFIKTKNVGSGRVEVHFAEAACGFCRVILSAVSIFSPADANNGWFSLRDVNGDGRGDLVFIKTHNTGSGRVELFVADGVYNYARLTAAIVTPFSPADANNGWFSLS